MSVKVVVEGSAPVDNVVNTDTISRFGPTPDGGSYIKFADGTSIHVVDPVSEITEVVLKADKQKA